MLGQRSQRGQERRAGRCRTRCGHLDFVLVTADLRASGESVEGKKTIIGRILERTLDRKGAPPAPGRSVRSVVGGVRLLEVQPKGEVEVIAGGGKGGRRYKLDTATPLTQCPFRR